MVFPEPDHPPPGEDVPLIDLGDSSGTYHPTTSPPVAGSCHDASASTFPAHNTTLGDTVMVHRQHLAATGTQDTPASGFLAPPTLDPTPSHVTRARNEPESAAMSPSSTLPTYPLRQGATIGDARKYPLVVYVAAVSTKRGPFRISANLAVENSRVRLSLSLPSSALSTADLPVVQNAEVVKRYRDRVAVVFLASTTQGLWVLLERQDGVFSLPSVQVSKDSRAPYRAQMRAFCQSVFSPIKSRGNNDTHLFVAKIPLPPPLDDSGLHLVSLTASLAESLPHPADFSGETAMSSMSAGSPVRTVTFVLANTILGAGMLGLPSAFAQCGLLVGLLLLGLFAATATTSLHLLSEAADRVGRPATFKTMCEASMPGFSLVFDLAIGIKCFGVATSYLIVCGDNMPAAMEALAGVSTGVLSSRRFWVLVSFVLAAPLSLLKNISRLRFTAAFSLVCVCIIIITVLLYAIHPSEEFNPCSNSSSSSCRGPIYAVKDVGSIVRSIPVFVFSYTCHQNIISTTNELARPTPLRAAAGMISAVGIALVTYITLATAGVWRYLTFGDYLTGDILKKYPEGSKVVAIARIGISLIVTMCYPLQAHPSRNCFTSVWNTLKDALKAHRERKVAASTMSLDSTTSTTNSTPLVDPLVLQAESEPAVDDHGNGVESSVLLYLSISAIFLCSSAAIALVVSDLTLILTIVGATGSTAVSYILPGACYMLLFWQDGGWRWFLALTILCLGLIIMPLSLALVAIPK
ncbi:hypothetical protein AB1Y20_010092 [Prymnesium parvum]|uniref:Amino acid transporter transmembrane domain-containing protein n=1 Tax=Prymnesium parvum TaxID=97485 RepID=A0AB34K692_PRYPA